MSVEAMIKLVLLRHGESFWNLENRFTGWADVDLSPRGVREAHDASRLLREHGLTFDVAHTSVLRRAIQTLWIVLDDLNLMWIPFRCDWRLNERHYGALEGLDKNEVARAHGEYQVQQWRRAYSERPPPLTITDERYPGHRRPYASLGAHELPLGESLEDTLTRLLPYWLGCIVPDLRAGRRVIIAAHHNSLRALVKHLDHIRDTDIVEVSIPTGIPLVYELGENLRPVRHYYLTSMEHHASNCRWAAPTLFLPAPFWWEAEDRPWACVHSGTPRALETTDACADCPNWERRAPGGIDLSSVR